MSNVFYIQSTYNPRDTAQTQEIDANVTVDVAYLQMNGVLRLKVAPGTTWTIEMKSSMNHDPIAGWTTRPVDL